jgi:hypothetical protein
LAQLFGQLITGMTGDSRRYRDPYAAAIRLPAARAIHLVQDNEPTLVVTHRDADAEAHLLGSSDRVVGDLFSF